MAFAAFRKTALHRVLPILKDVRASAPLARHNQTGGSDEYGSPSLVLKLAPAQAPSPPAAGPARAISSKDLREVLRAVQAVEGRRLPVEVTSKLLRLQAYLPHVRATDFEVKLLGCIFREVVDRRLMVDALLYHSMLRTITVNAPRLGMSSDAVAAALEEVITAAAVTFRANPIPVLSTLLPLYINACLGLELYDSLGRAKAVLSTVRLPPADEVQKRALFAESLETFTMALFEVAEMWNKKAVRPTNVNVITRTGRRRTKGVKVSTYHYKVLTSIQSIFNQLEAKTDAIKAQLEGAEAMDDGAMFMDQTARGLPCPEFLASDDCEPVLLPRFRFPLRRMPKMPPP